MTPTLDNMAFLYEHQYNISNKEAYCIATVFIDAIHFVGSPTNLMISNGELLGCLNILLYQNRIDRPTLDKIFKDFQIIVRHPSPDLALKSLQDHLDHLFHEIRFSPLKDCLLHLQPQQNGTG